MSDSSRHWNGVFGDRHEHQNVWVRGAYPTYPPTNIPTKTSFPAKVTEPVLEPERRDSTASAASNASASAVSANANDGTNSGQAERRKSSAGASPSLFQSLVDQKRNSTDPALAARRVSWNEQSPKGGFVSKWWDEYTKR